jgi:hydrogenase large subunit
MAMITVDPVTRIEGHLRVDVQAENGRVTNAWSSGQMWRGIELILKDRDPRDAWAYTQRICGVCTTVHAVASVRAVEDALKLEIPANAQYIRNMILISHALHDHIVHFYHLSALDWVDVVSALDADPREAARIGASLSDWPGNSVQELTQVKQKLQTLVNSGQLGIFANGYWGHSAMRLPPAVNLLAAAHYLQALEYQRKATQATAILGAKTPHIQNLTVGGVANPINLDNQSALNMEKLYRWIDLMRDVNRFIQEAYLPDVAAVAAHYPDWLGYGAGVTNYMAVPDLPLDAAATEFDLPGGFLSTNGGPTGPLDSWNNDRWAAGVTETAARAWYEKSRPLHPHEGETNPAFTGFDYEGDYSWVKAPRFEGVPMQVGPLAQVLVGLEQGHPRFVKYGTRMLETAGGLAGMQLGPEVLHSTLGRHATRAIRAGVLTDLAEKHWQLLVDNIGSGDTESFREWEYPTHEVRGYGVHEAPRGVLSHWIVIEDEKIKNYQAVVPSTWNAGPRDEDGQLGPYEASLIGNPVADPNRPLEVVRTVHSFDPCLACAIHTLDPEGRELSKVRAVGY